MNCEQAQLLITLAAYGELRDDSRPALELHLSGCSRCREEFESVKALQDTLSAVPPAEPSANLLAKSRIALEETLDTMPRDGWLVRSWRTVRAGGATLTRAPVAASLLLVFGLCFGGFSGYHAARRANTAASIQSGNSAAGQVFDQPIQVADVNSITQNPESQDINVRFDRVVPETVSGSLSDPEIRQLLLMGARGAFDPGVQQASVTLLAQQCQQRVRCPEGPARSALLVALRHSRNSVVRLTALSGLEPYVAQDLRVRDAVLESLMQDPDPALRSRALQMLEPVQVDTTVREVLRTVATADDNPDIRTASREVLEQMPPVQ